MTGRANRKSDRALQALANKDRALLQVDFLRAYAEMFNAGRAADIAGVSRSAVQHWRQVDPAFREAYNELYQRHIDTAEETLFEIGTDPALNPNARVNALINVLFAHRKKKYQRPGVGNSEQQAETQKQNFTFQFVMGPKPQVEAGPPTVDASVVEEPSAERREADVVADHREDFVDAEQSEANVVAPVKTDQDIPAE